METQTKAQNPVKILTNYGTSGATVTLSLAQLNVLGSVYTNIVERDNDLTTEEASLLPFLKIFKDYSSNISNVWSNFRTDEVTEVLVH